MTIEEKRSIALAAIYERERSSAGLVALEACIGLAASDGEHGVSLPRELVAVWVRGSTEWTDWFAGVDLRQRRP